VLVDPPEVVVVVNPLGLAVELLEVVAEVLEVAVEPLEVAVTNAGMADNVCLGTAEVLDRGAAVHWCDPFLLL
jgi:hypothetical protein